MFSSRSRKHAAFGGGSRITLQEDFMTHRTVLTAGALMLAALILSPKPAAAQEARSFEQLQVLVKPGDRIFVTDKAGNETEGRVEGLSRSALSLRTKTSTKDWTESDVSRIRQWRHDSLKNGAIIGTGVGLGLGIAGALIFCGEFGDCGGEAAAAIAVYGGIGAGIGVGIDALIPSKRTVFTGGPQTALGRFKVKPIVSSSRKGVAVAFSF
jgi:hypothetical protein